VSCRWPASGAHATPAKSLHFSPDCPTDSLVMRLLVADLILPVFDGDTGDDYIPDWGTKRKAASQSQHRFSSWEQCYEQ
jgi:hypothetical protein